MARKRSTRSTANVGTVLERPRKGSGTWHAYLPASMGDGKRVRVPGIFRSEAEARVALNDFIADLRSERREVPSAGTPTNLAQAVERYIEYRSTAARGRWAAATEQGLSLIHI